MIKEQPLGIKGKLDYELRDKNGNLIDEGHDINTITTFMNTHVALQVATPTAGSEIGFMGIGSGTGQTAASTDLANYVNMIALSGDGGLQAGSDVVYSGYWAAGAGTGSIREAGVFQVSGTSRSNMCTYNDGITVNKGASDTLKIDWTITFG